MGFVEFLFNTALMIVAFVAGGACLLYGRQRLDFSLGAVGLYLGLLVGMEINQYEVVWDLVVNQEWIWLLVGVGLGAAGFFLGRANRSITISVIGVMVGIAIFLYLDEIMLYAAGSSPDTPPHQEWWLLAILAGFGVAGFLATRFYSDTSLILLTTWIGASLILDGLRFGRDNAFVAIITLSLLLLGVVYQFAQYLREQPQTLGEHQLPDIR